MGKIPLRSWRSARIYWEFKGCNSMDIHKAGSIAFKDVGNIQDVFIKILYNSGIRTDRKG